MGPRTGPCAPSTTALSPGVGAPPAAAARSRLVRNDQSRHCWVLPATTGWEIRRDGLLIPSAGDWTNPSIWHIGHAFGPGGRLLWELRLLARWPTCSRTWTRQWTRIGNRTAAGRNSHLPMVPAKPSNPGTGLMTTPSPFLPFAAFSGSPRALLTLIALAKAFQNRLSSQETIRPISLGIAGSERVWHGEIDL
jgi:hypothetical protein